jgi:hypothetical protein
MTIVILTAANRPALTALAEQRGVTFDPENVIDFDELEASGDDNYKGGWRTLTNAGVVVLGQKL